MYSRLIVSLKVYRHSGGGGVQADSQNFPLSNVGIDNEGKDPPQELEKGRIDVR